MRQLKRMAIVCTLCLLISSAVYLFKNKEDINFEIETNMYLLTQFSENMQYTVITDNTMKCDLTTISNIVLHLETDGYFINSEKFSKDTIDIILTKENIAYRLFYKKDGSLISICNEYEKSYIPFTYINEK